MRRPRTKGRAGTEDSLLGGGLREITVSGLVIPKFRSLETLTRAISMERSGKKEAETPYKQPFAAEESSEMRREARPIGHRAAAWAACQSTPEGRRWGPRGGEQRGSSGPSASVPTLPARSPALPMRPVWERVSEFR